MVHLVSLIILNCLVCQPNVFFKFLVFSFSDFEVTDVLWISTYLFAAVYSSFEDGDCPKFLLISTPVSKIILSYIILFIFQISILYIASRN